MYKLSKVDHRYHDEFSPLSGINNFICFVRHLVNTFTLDDKRKMSIFDTDIGAEYITSTFQKAFYQLSKSH